MRLAFLELPADEHRLYIEQAAARLNLSPVVLERTSMRLRSASDGHVWLERR